MNDQHWWWLSSVSMTVAVSVRDGIIEDTPPLVRKFTGQPLKNLCKWMGKQEGFKIRALENGPDSPYGFKKGRSTECTREQ